MTTIVWDGYDLAADRLMTEDNARAGYINKIIKLEGGGYIAFCGDADIGELFAGWMNGKREPPSDEKMKDSAVFLVDGSGRCYDYDGTASVCLQLTKPFARGTGAKFALAALDLGHTAKEAVQVAIKRDIYSGGKVDVVSINPRKEKKEKQIG